MKKLLISVSLSSIIFSGLHATPLTKQEIKNVAINYAYKKGGEDLKVKKVITAEKLLKKLVGKIDFKDEEPLLSLVQLKPQGWVIVSGDDIANPIIGYSLESTFDEDNLPPQLEAMLEIFAEEINTESKKTDIAIPLETSLAWEKLKMDTTEYSVTYPYEDKNVKSARATTTWRLTKDVTLNTPTWWQANYYNDQCPQDNDVESFNDSRTPTGCVATAMSEIMRYHSWPTTGMGSHSYQSDYGTETANFGNTTYNWNTMPLGRLTSTNDAIATIMYHTGVSVNMKYGTNVSSAYSSAVPGALRTYFSYQTYGRFSKSSFSNVYEWYQMIKTDLRQGFPVYYDGVHKGVDENGKKQEYGHAFVIDGFDVDGNLFHINWGANGSSGSSSDGMYRLYALNYDSNNQYNYNQTAILGIKPNNSTYRDPYEKDNTWQTSSYMTINGVNSRKNGHSISPKSDRDWINFYNDATRTITIETMNSPYGDTTLTLYNQYGQYVASDDDGGSGLLSKITKTLSSGTYYIEVESYENEETVSSYDIEIRD